MSDIVRRLTFADAPPRPGDADDPENVPVTAREWLVTNGLGGYASGTVSGLVTRRFHGLLIAALPGPLGRTMMFNYLTEELHLEGGTTVRMDAQERPRPDVGREPRAARLTEFRLEYGLPVWTFDVGGGVSVEKRIAMPHRQNTVRITYRLIGATASARLLLAPWVHFRPHEGTLDTPVPGDYAIKATPSRYEISTDEQHYPPLRIAIENGSASFTIAGAKMEKVPYPTEKSRGYDAIGALYAAGYFLVDLTPDRPVTMVASTESWDRLMALTPDEADSAERSRRLRLIDAADPAARTGMAAELVLAADQFIMTPTGRIAATARARAAGDEIRTVIAGYHWFTDWGRDTMISLEGLTLVTGRATEAGFILRTFAHAIKDGLIPNMFPEGKNAGLYHTADATLWFFHAIERWYARTGDRTTLRWFLPLLKDIVDHHVKGTRFGIGVDPKDGLLRQGEKGYQLTWMDAKVGDDVITPRRGKAVEINALFYNALRLLERWLREESDPDAPRIGGLADRVKDAFNARFWFPAGNYLYDVVDGEHGDDSAFRPNQVFAVSLSNPVLDPSRWATVVDAVREKLLTPFGLRSLAPGEPDYRPKYFGDLRSRDMAYHQGTVWAWLIGPFVDAWLKVHPDKRREAREMVLSFEPHLDEACIGSISEIFDAEAPFVPRGCIAQAWSVAEVLRILAATGGAT